MKNIRSPLKQQNNPQYGIALAELGFNTNLTAKVISWGSITYMFPGFLTPVLTQLSFQSHKLFLHASAEVKDEK